MQTDRTGQGLTTDSAEAAAAFDRAVRSYVTWRTDAVAHLDAAIAADPGFALPYAVKGLLTTGLRKAGLRGAVAALRDKAQAARAPETERERRYLAALDAALAGRITGAAAQYESIARAAPQDLLALRLSQFELFWIGEVDWMRDISERAAAHWSPEAESYGSYLAIRAFGLEETGDYAGAERCGREAIERDPSDPWAAHAVAHVLVMQARLADGVAFLGGLTGNWDHVNNMRHHNWWHLALFHAEAGDYPAALEIYDTRLRDLDSPLMQALPDFCVDIQNDVALLQRLELRGVDVGDRWAPIADLAAGRVGDHTSPFTSAHCALALAAAGRDAEADETLRLMRGFAAEDSAAGGALGPTLRAWRRSRRRRARWRTGVGDFEGGARHHGPGAAEFLADGRQPRPARSVLPALRRFGAAAGPARRAGGVLRGDARARARTSRRTLELRRRAGGDALILRRRGRLRRIAGTAEIVPGPACGTVEIIDLLLANFPLPPFAPRTGECRSTVDSSCPDRWSSHRARAAAARDSGRARRGRNGSGSGPGTEAPPPRGRRRADMRRRRRQARRPPV
jgi:tetratricopeptide (TPR) repeat protein